MKIGTSMQEALNKEFTTNCFSTIDFFQLRSGSHLHLIYFPMNSFFEYLVDLPDKFEEAIQQTEVKKQEIQRAYAEKNKTSVELETITLTAAYQRNITLVRFCLI
jgi:hypothetical protein